MWIEEEVCASDLVRHRVVAYTIHSYDVPKEVESRQLSYYPPSSARYIQLHTFSLGSLETAQRSSSTTTTTAALLSTAHSSQTPPAALLQHDLAGHTSHTLEGLSTSSEHSQLCGRAEKVGRDEHIIEEPHVHCGARHERAGKA